MQHLQLRERRHLRRRRGCVRIHVVRRSDEERVRLVVEHGRTRVRSAPAQSAAQQAAARSEPRCRGRGRGITRRRPGRSGRRRLQRALQKAEPLSDEQSQALKEGDEERTHISVNQRGRLKLIPLKDIAYFKAENKYVVIKTREGEYLLNDTLNQLENELGTGFIRGHRNALISTRFLEGMEKIDEDRWQVFLDGFDNLNYFRAKLAPMHL